MSDSSGDGLLPPTGSGLRRRIPANETRHRRRTLLLGALFIVLSALVVNAIVGENGYLAALAARKERAELTARLTRLRLDNERLQQERKRLLSDPAALEETARRELGLLKPGETLLIIRDPTPASSDSAVR